MKKEFTSRLLISCLYVAALTAMISCGNASSNDPPPAKNNSKSPVKAASIVGDWKLTSKVCDGTPLTPSPSEELDLGNGGSAVAYLWREGDGSHSCKRLVGFLFQMTTVSHQSDSSGKILDVQTGLFKPAVSKRTCWHLKSGNIDGDPYIDQSEDLDGPRQEGTFSQSSDAQIILDINSSPFCNGGKSILAFKRI